jgi:hypothetical protein
MKKKRVSVEIKFSDITPTSCEYFKVNGKDIKNIVNSFNFEADADKRKNKLVVSLIPEDMTLIGAVPNLDRNMKFIYSFLGNKEEKVNKK